MQTQNHSKFLQSSKFCFSDNLHSKLDVVFQILDSSGGIFIGENTWMLNYPPSSRSIDIDYAVQLEGDGTVDGYVMMRAGLYSEFRKREWNLEENQAQIRQQREKGLEFQPTKTVEHLLKEIFHSSSSINNSPVNQDNDLIESINDDAIIDRSAGADSNPAKHSRRSSCFKIQQLYTDEKLKNASKCAIVKGGAFERFYPMDVWQLDDPFGRLARKLFYGSERIRLPVPRSDA